MNFHTRHEEFHQNLCFPEIFGRYVPVYEQKYKWKNIGKSKKKNIQGNVLKKH